MTDKTDRELLELAAKAAGISGGWGDKIEYHNGAVDLRDVWILEGDDFVPWNPLIDDGDALRLAAALELELLIYHGYGEVWADCLCGNHRGVAVFTENRADDYRHAIVRAAASIGEQMK